MEEGGNENELLGAPKSGELCSYVVARALDRDIDRSESFYIERQREV